MWGGDVGFVLWLRTGGEHARIESEHEYAPVLTLAAYWRQQGERALWGVKCDRVL